MMKGKRAKGHPADEVLLTYSESERPSEADPKVQAHLEDGCQRCLRRVEVFREVLASLEAPALIEAPEELVQTALARLRQIAAGEAAASHRLAEARDSALGMVRRILREVQMGLVLDSGLGVALPGIRGATAMQPRQLLYESSEGSVHLQVQKGAGGKLELMGQFLPAEGSLEGKTRVILEREGKKTPRNLSPTGEFRFSSIAPGRIQLRVEWKDSLLTAGPLDLGEGPMRE